MPGLVRIWFLFGVFAFLPSPIRADSPKSSTDTDLERLRIVAEFAERNGKWDKALEYYLRLYTEGERTPDVRDHIRTCIRNLNQIHRHRDPAFQDYILSLSASDSLTLYTEALSKIHTHYADRERCSFNKLFSQGLTELDSALADPEFRKKYCPEANEQKIAKFREKIGEVWQVKLPTNAREARLMAREVIATAQSQLNLKNPAVVVLELLAGACGGLDEFSSYQVPRSVDQKETTPPILEFAAYGIMVSVKDDGLWIENIVPNSWAAVTTILLKGDRITKLNQIDLTKPSLPDLLRAIKAPASPSAHEMEVTHVDAKAGDEPLKVNLPRPVPSVYGTRLLKEGIGFIRIGLFRDTTLQELDDAITQLKQDGLRGLILDLRGNPGGSFLSSIATAKRFLPAGLIASTTGQLPEFSGTPFTSDSGMSAHDVPVVLLVDTRTMSAAEVFTAALKENNRATLVGQDTFGKGLIQCPIPLKSLDGSDAQGNKSGWLFLSVGSVVGPRGTPIHGGGIVPHFSESDPVRQVDTAVNKLTELLSSSEMQMPRIMR